MFSMFANKSTTKKKTLRGVSCKNCADCGENARSNSAKKCWNCSTPYVRKTKKRSSECLQGRTTKKCPDCGKPAKSNRSSTCIDLACGFVFKASKRRRIVSLKPSKKKSEIRKKKSEIRKTTLDIPSIPDVLKIDNMSTDMMLDDMLSDDTLLDMMSTAPPSLERSSSLEPLSSVTSGFENEYDYFFGPLTADVPASLEPTTHNVSVPEIKRGSSINNLFDMVTESDDFFDLSSVVKEENKVVGMSKKDVGQLKTSLKRKRESSVEASESSDETSESSDDDEELFESLMKQLLD